MAEQDGSHGFLDAATIAFLARRLQNRRVRAAEARGVPDPSSTSGAGAPTGMDLAASGPDGAGDVAPLSIVVMIVGSRGDVQPFIPIGRRLAARHRVRIATHREFRSMVESAGLEFYPLAGDPHELMEYLARTGGRVIPTHLDQIVEDVPRKRAVMAEILASTWRACTEPDPDHAHAPAFRADLIVANPPSYGHIHCAEALRVPLHMIFTMPWTATRVYPHPFAGIDPGERHPVKNFLSYGVVDLLIWSGIGDVVDAFRRDILKLPPLALVDGAALLEDHEVPFTYLWPEILVPRPDDWGPHIDVANFAFYDQAHVYQPPVALLDFLGAGEAPIYVGFGSVAVEDPAAVTRTIFTALERAGARGVVSEGWAHLGGGALPPNVFLVGDCPHDWLFPRCRAVCHHGGAGTTAAGLRAGLPSIVVPSFGDQFFWGHVIAKAGAGPEPIPISRLDSAALAEAFEMCRQPQMRERARALSTRVLETDGADLAVQSVYRRLPGPSWPRPNDSEHSSHGTHPYFVDWGAHPSRGLVSEVGQLIGDAAVALQAALVEVIPRMGLRR